MKKAAVDLLLLAQREKYLSLLRQALRGLEFGVIAMNDEAHAYHRDNDWLDAERGSVERALEAVREALK
jgi:hypothetical protein